MNRTLCIFIGMICAASAAAGDFATYDKPTEYKEVPLLLPLVEAGKLPPIEQRIPEEPLVLGPGDAYGVTTVGRYCTRLMNDAVDAPNVQGPTDITVPFFHDMRGNFYPLVFKSYEVSDDTRIWTFHMRRGMKWSDGHLFTADDVVFWYEAVAMNSELSPTPPSWLMEGNKPVTLQKIDTYTFRFVFTNPSLRFLPVLASCERQITGAPKHYLSQFHPDYADKETIDKHLEAEQLDSWTQLWEAKMDMFQNSNNELPSLCPWIVKVGIPANPTRYVRNPYSWVVDSEGRQLPYADYVLYTLVGNPERMKLRKALGYVSFGNMPLDSIELAKMEADKGHIRIGLRPPPGDINTYTLAFNFLAQEPFKAKLINDRRFRIAMSLQMPRQEINEIMDNGLTRPKQIGISDPTHPWYNKKLATAYLDYDVDEANRLLDEMELTERDSDGIRLDPEGNPIIFNLITIHHQQWLPVANIIAEYLPKVGLKANVRATTWSGAESVMRQAKWDMWVHQETMGYPHQWPSRMDAVRPSLGNAYKWMRWMQTDGEHGIEPTDIMKECWRHWQAALSSASEAELTEHVQWLQSTAADEMWAVGINSFPPGLQFHAPNVHNVPFDKPNFLKTAVWVDESIKQH